MSQTVVIYRSKHGHTQKIAEMISEELNADLFSSKDINKIDTSKYDSFVFGSSIYCGMISGKKELSKLYPMINGKKLAFFTVGLTELDKEEYYTKLIDMNFANSEIKNKAMIFHFLGGINYKSLGFLSRKIIGMIVKQTELKENKTENDKRLLKVMTEEVNLDSGDSVAQLIEYIQF